MPDKIKALSNDTTKLIKSSQVITSVSSAIKELIENSLDAGSTIISIKLEKYGYHKLEVKDNGEGVNAEDMKIIAKPHTTSKLSSFEDLGNLDFYGFRGEALSSLCSLSDVSIRSKSQDEPLGYNYEFNNDGDLIKSSPIALPGGTTVSVLNLFKNIPVRKQYYSNLIRRKNDLKKIEDTILAFSIIKPKMYLSFLHEGCTIFKRNSVETTENAVMTVFMDCYNKMKKCHKECIEVSIDLWLPDRKYAADLECNRSSGNRLFIFVNDRPVNFRAAEKLTKKYFCRKTEGNYRKYPVGAIIIKVDGNSVDVNLEPNKDRVCLQKETLVLELLESMLLELYGTIHGESSIPRSLSQNKKEKKPEKCVEAVTPVGLLGQSDYLSSAEISIFDEEHDKFSVLEHTEDSLHNVINKNNSKETANDGLINAVENIKIPLPCTKNYINDSPIVKTSASFFDNVNHIPIKTSVSIFDDAEEEITKLPSDKSHPNEDGRSNNYDMRKTINPLSSIENSFDLSVSGGNAINVSNNGNMWAKDNKRSSIAAVIQPAQNLESTVSFSSEAWSKGNVLSSGTNIQNVRILSGPKRPISSLDISGLCVRDGFKTDDKSNQISKKQKCNPVKSNTNRSAFFPTKKPPSAFSLFAKDVRHDIVSKNPGVDFTIVGQEISKRWKELDAETRDWYERMSLNENKGFYNEIGHKIPPKSVSMANLSVNFNDSVNNVEMLIAPNTPQLKKITTMVQDTPSEQPWKNKQLVIPFNLKRIQAKCFNKFTKIIEDGLLGKLEDNVGWLYCNQGSICCLNSWRLNEFLLYESLMQNYKFDCSILENPLSFDERIIGKMEWFALISLEKVMEGYVNCYTITDRRMTLNGFNVVLYCNSSDVITNGEIIGLTSAVDNYGFSDLCEILDCISKKEDPIAQCRPLKLREFIKAECVRISTSATNIINAETISAKMKKCKLSTLENNNMCLHSKPILFPLFDTN